MRKSADVLEVIDQETAKIMLYKHKKCHGCGFCNRHMHPGSVFPALNNAHARPGDMVSVNVYKRFSAAEFSIVYLLPIAAFFAGLFLGTALLGKSGGAAAVLLAFIALLAAIVVNIGYKKRYHPNYTVSIVKVIQPAEPRL